MNLLASMHFLHRAWRYRLRSEKFGMSFLFSRELRGKTVLDLGANRGIYSYWMHRLVGARGRVFAFEPQPELCQYIGQVRDRFQLRRLEVVGMGLSSEVGELTLRRPLHHWGGASYHYDDDGRESIKTPVTTLDTFFAQHTARPISFIKCDVEGHENHVFRGAEQILANDRPDLLFECHEVENPNCEVFSYLRELEYDGFCFLGDGFAPISKYGAIRNSIHRKALVDFVFLPRERTEEIARRCA